MNCFLEHIKVGFELAANDSSALLMLSGGQTRSEAGPRSESSSYLDALEMMLNSFDLYNNTNNIQRRIYTEDFARDSLQNLLFSFCRFQQITHKYPEKITVVGFPFKAARFIDLHAKVVLKDDLEEAISFQYLPVKCVLAEEVFDDAFAAFGKDLIGCGEELKSKRERRNPFRQVHSYASCSHYLLQESCHKSI